MALELAANLSTTCAGSLEHALLEPAVSNSLWGLSSFSAAFEAIMLLPILSWVVGVTATLFGLAYNTIPAMLAERKPSAAKKVSSSAWLIHGKKYDLSSWVKDHPGGEWAIELGRNRDCTGLFESYHIFADRAKLEKILARFEIADEVAPEVPGGKAIRDMVGSNQTGLVFNDAFHQEVIALMKSHFQGGSHKMKEWVGYMMLAIIVIELYLAYLFLKGSNIAVVLLPTIGFILCGNLAHDGSHFAVSDRPWMNRLASIAGLPLFFPSTCWAIQHVVQHHIYTNDEDDVDLYHFLPVCRTSRLTKWASQYQLQWLAVFLVLPTTVGHLQIVVPTDLITRQLDLVTGKKRYSQCTNLEDLVQRCGDKIVLELLASISFWLLSMYTQGAVEGLKRVFMALSVASFWFIVITQGAHLQQDCMVGKEDHDKSWAKRQAATSVNFCPDSYVWLFFTGALNMQSLHHVVPGIGSSQLIDVYPEYKRICAKHGVELKEVNSLTEFFRGFVGWIQELAKEEVDTAK